MQEYIIWYMAWRKAQYTAEYCFNAVEALKARMLYG